MLDLIATLSVLHLQNCLELSSGQLEGRKTLMKGNLDMKISGECHCGEIAYEAELDLKKVGICHCSDCQSLSASAFRTLAVVAGDTFTLTRGTPKEYVKVGDSGNRRIQAFCANCGSGLYATDIGANPKAYNIRAGTVKMRRELVPQFECWRQSALPWLPENRHTKKFDQSP